MDIWAGMDVYYYYYLFVTCTWVVNRWQESVTLVHVIQFHGQPTVPLFTSGWGYMESSSNFEVREPSQHLLRDPGTQGNQEKPVSRWPVTRPSSSWLIASLLAYNRNRQISYPRERQNRIRDAFTWCDQSWDCLFDPYQLLFFLCKLNKTLQYLLYKSSNGTSVICIVNCVYLTL